MSLDIKYRPRTYDEVIGQEDHVKVLRQFVKEGRGFQQSYLFAGAKGCGKTTLGRILARALLCESPVDGNPCDECDSCVAMLDENSSHECFTEYDAATNSSKEQIQEIVVQQKYETFSGRNRIYLIDECHRLSQQAMDGLLKPLEDTRPGSLDRILTCIFATTEPHKVRDTISSRCATTFHIHKVTPEVLAKRLAYVCEQEEISFELPALQLIAETSRCHVRDSLQALSGVSVLGAVTQESVQSYMRLDADRHYINILANLGRDLRSVVESADELQSLIGASTCFEKLADAAMTIHKVRSVGLGKIPSFWPPELIEGLSEAQVRSMVEIAHWMSKRPGRPTHAMLLCDLTTLHYRLAGGAGVADPDAVVVVQQVPSLTAPAQHSAPSAPPPSTPESTSDSADSTATGPSPDSNPGTVEETTAEAASHARTTHGVYVDDRCRKPPPGSTSTSDEELDVLGAEEGRRLLKGRLKELRGGRSTRRPNLGNS